MLNTRIKEVRTQLELSQSKFGEKIGVSRDAIANIENNRVQPQESLIKLICLTFNVNENWLQFGTGEMFTGVSKSELDRLAERYNLKPLAKRIVEAFVTLEEKEMDTVLKFVREISAIAYSEVSATAESYSEAQANESFINDEVEKYRYELEAEQKGEISSVLENLKGDGRKNKIPS